MVPSSPPVPSVDLTVLLGGHVVDLATRVLVAGVVPAPRFGRESEVVATAGAVIAHGADLVDVSLPPRMIGAVVGASGAPVVVRAASLDQALGAAHAGAAVVLMPADVVAQVVERGRQSGMAASPAVVVDDLAEAVAARTVAERLGLTLAVDATRWSGPDAMARETMAIAEGCRLIRTNDVRRSRRVAEVMSAILGARRSLDPPATSDDSEALP